MATIAISSGRRRTFLPHFYLKPGFVFGLIILTALLAFELFNYGTTDFALHDLLGELNFVGIRWSTILAIAFCGIDFAGIARLLTPQDGSIHASDTWYLFSAWLLAALMNATLTWWGVSIAILEHQSLGGALVSRASLLHVVPIFVAVLVWLIRVLIIGSISLAGMRLFSQGQTDSITKNGFRTTPSNFDTKVNSSKVTSAMASKANKARERYYSQPEPIYHPAAMVESGLQNENIAK